MQTRCAGLAKIFLLIGLVALPSCGRSETDYCGKLHRVASDSIVRQYLIDWVKAHVIETPVERKRIKVGGLMVPGRYVLLDEPDWTRLGFSAEESQVRLVGLRALDVENGAIHSRIASVFLGERSRYGLIVDVPNAPGIGLSSDVVYVSWVADGLGVLCMDIDW